MPKAIGFEEKVFTGLHYLVRDSRIAVKTAQDHRDMLERIYDAKDVKVTYKVTVDSMWANEGEESVTASSIDIKRAIKNAGKRHHGVNKRNDWQVYWRAQVLFTADGETASYALHPDMFKQLLPGGQVDIPLKLRTNK